MPKLKLTAFGRFVIFLLIAAPIAYFGAKYLKQSGALEKVQEKVESKEIDRRPESSEESDGGILGDINRQSDSESKSEEESVIEAQRRRIEELERKNQELRNQKQSLPNTNPPSEKSVPSATNNNTDNAPSLDDLISQAEKNLGRPSSSDEVPSSSRETLAVWSFSFSGVNGSIEFFKQNDRLMSRATYQGLDRVDIMELQQRGERFYVKGSPTDEYYVIRDDGKLDAYDRDGFQTTCTRLK